MRHNTFFIIIIFLFSACKFEVDKTPPSIELLSSSHPLISDTICGSLEPDNVFRLRSGETLQLQIRFSDNEALSQYKLDIHHNFDCHGHKNITVNPWQLLRIVDISGKELIENISIPVPDDATAGNYHFQVRCIDMEGNDAGALQAYSIVVQNTHDTVPPQINISSPSGEIISHNKGETLLVSGRVSDNEDLAGGRLELVYFTLSGNKSEALSFPLNASHGSSYDFQLSFVLPQSLPKGDYPFELRAYDAVGNSYFAPSFTVQLQ